VSKSGSKFDGVVAALRKPNLPAESGLMLVSYSPMEESGHGLGRLLRQLTDTALAEAVVAEVQVEIDSDDAGRAQ
jgi:hypothetical protein